MARKLRAENNDGTGAGQPTRAVATNGFDPEKAVEYVDSIERVQVLIGSIMQDARDQCEPLRDDIVRLKKTAAEVDSIPRRALNSVLSERRLRTKAAAVRENLSDGAA